MLHVCFTCFTKHHVLNQMLYKTSCWYLFLIIIFLLPYETITVLNSLRCLKREVQETRLPSSSEQVNEEDIKMFKRTQELSSKVKRGKLC